VLAAVYHGRRDVRLREIAEPGVPDPHEVQIALRRVALCGTDVGEYAHGPLMVPLHRSHPGSGHVGPLVLGHEMVGDVVAVGGDVETMRVGDRIVPGAGMWCGHCRWCLAGRTNLCATYYTLGLNADGGLTERLNVPERMCHPVPSGCGLDAAAMAQPMAVALHAAHRAGVGADETAVLIGVGGIGLFLLAALLSVGARVIAVDVDPARLQAARRLGADVIVDAGGADAEEQLHDVLGRDQADAVIEASGAPASPGLAQRLVRRGGHLVLVGLQAEPRALDLSDLVLREVDIITSVAHVCGHDLPRALALLTDGALAAEALDRVIPLASVVTDGLEPLAAREIAGKVVVSIGDG
jgi:(R,R)-butanediol dehydrogenase/meso-butanediol dehydrogenase/diacetyl reductase